MTDVEVSRCSRPEVSLGASVLVLSTLGRFSTERYSTTAPAVNCNLLDSLCFQCYLSGKISCVYWQVNRWRFPLTWLVYHLVLQCASLLFFQLSSSRYGSSRYSSDPTGGGLYDRTSYNCSRSDRPGSTTSGYSRTSYGGSTGSLDKDGAVDYKKVRNVDVWNTVWLYGKAAWKVLFSL